MSERRMLSRDLRATAAAAALLSTASCHTEPRAADAARGLAAPGSAQPRAIPVELGVRLVPDGGAAANTIGRFVLENGSTSEIAGLEPWPGLSGTFERQGPDGRWFAHPPRAGYCATLDVTASLAPGAALGVSELPVMGEHLFPPGHYRFVLPFLEAGRPGSERRIVLPITVAGLDAHESEALVDALNSRVCPFSTRAMLLDAVETTAAPEALPRLIDLRIDPAEPFGERLAPFEAVARFPEWSDLLIAATEGSGLAALPAAVALLRESSCSAASPRCVAGVTRIGAALRAADAAPREAIDALGYATALWPETVVEGLVDLLARTRSDELRLALADVLARAGAADVTRLGAHPRAIVAALAQAAGAAHDSAAREGIAQDGHVLAVALGDEPPGSHIGVAFAAPGREAFTSSPSCEDFLATIAPLLRFARPRPLGAEAPDPRLHAALVVRYGVSAVEPYRAPSAE